MYGRLSELDPLTMKNVVRASGCLPQGPMLFPKGVLQGLFGFLAKGFEGLFEGRDLVGVDGPGWGVT